MSPRVAVVFIMIRVYMRLWVKLRDVLSELGLWGIQRFLGLDSRLRGNDGSGCGNDGLVAWCYPALWIPAYAGMTVLHWWYLEKRVEE